MSDLRLVVSTSGGVGASTLAGALAHLERAVLAYEHRGQQDAARAAGLPPDVFTLNGVLDRVCMENGTAYVVVARDALTSHWDETRSFVVDAMSLGINTSAIVVVPPDYLVDRPEIPTLEKLGVHLTLAVASQAPPAAAAAFVRMAATRMGYSVIRVPRVSRASARDWEASGLSLAEYVRWGKRITTRAAIAGWLAMLETRLRFEFRGV